MSEIKRGRFRAENRASSYQTDCLAGETNPLRTHYADFDHDVGQHEFGQTYQTQHSYLPPAHPGTQGGLSKLSRRYMLALGGCATAAIALAGIVPLMARRGPSAKTKAFLELAAQLPQTPTPISPAMLEASEAIEYLDLESQTSAPQLRMRSALDEPSLPDGFMQRPSLAPPSAPSSVPSSARQLASRTLTSAPLPANKPLGINNKANRYLAIQRSLSKPASISDRPLIQQVAYSPGSPTGPGQSFDMDAAISDMLREYKDEAAEVASRAPEPPQNRPSRPAIVTSANKLKLKNAHTGEALAIAYRSSDGRADQGAIRELKYFMRDWRTGDQGRMDQRLYDLMAYLGSDWGRGAEMVMISGYRSPKTNSMLASKSGGVAKKSYHMLGKAIDFRLSGRSLKQTYHQALRMNAGGVGYYPGSNFIHMDTGPVREWPAKYKQYAQTYRKQSLA